MNSSDKAAVLIIRMLIVFILGIVLLDILERNINSEYNSEITRLERKLDSLNNYLVKRDSIKYYIYQQQKGLK